MRSEVKVCISGGVLGVEYVMKNGKLTARIIRVIFRNVATEKVGKI